MIEKQAMDDLNLDALDLSDLIADQVRRLGAHSRTGKAVQIFGQIGQQSQVYQFSSVDSPVTSDPRRPLGQRTLLHLLFDTSVNFVETVVSTIMLGIMDILRWVWKTCSANSIILAILGLSVLTNMFYSSRDSWQWWHERSATKYMARLGIRPDMTMSRAIYVRDMDQILTNTTAFPTSVGGSCYSSFHESLGLDDLDTPHLLPDASTSFLDSYAQAAARRLQRTRQGLSSYRHDLLVAMRVVNSVEKEVLTAEWEKWVLHENRRCRQVEAMLGRNATHDGKGVQKMVDAKAWYDDYCGSCRAEQERLTENLGLAVE